MPQPIPLHGFQGSAARAGTGFLVENGTDYWLVTCVHIITGLKNSTSAVQSFLGGRLQIVGTPTVLHLFRGGIQRFSAVTNITDGYLADVLAVKLTATEAAELQSYGTYNLSTVVAPIQGEAVTATGFPGMQNVLVASTTMTGHIAEIVGMSVKLSVPGSNGYSGSALLGVNGLIGIVHGDVGMAPHLVNALAISFDVVGPQLFV